MDGCIFTLTINMAMAVYGADLSTQVDQVGVNDRVCVTRIENGWTEIHFNRGNIGRTGYLKDVTVQQNAAPTAPLPREEPYEAPLNPTPTPSEPPAQKQEQQGQFSPDSKLIMVCSPVGGKPYAAVLTMKNTETIEIVSASGTTRPYPIFDMNNNKHKHVLYIAAKRQDQDRTLYFAFDYSQKGDDVSAIRVKAPNGYDAKDKCSMQGVK